MAIALFMEYENKLIKFPVNPEKVEIEKPGTNSTVEVVKLGEINIAKNVSLASISFESFLPSNKNAPYVLTSNQFEGPTYYIDFINKVRNDKKPVRFVISDLGVNYMVLIEDFSYSFVAGTDDVDYSISLKEYKEAEIITLKLSNSDGKKQTQKKPASNKTSSTKPYVGCNVIVNGRLYRDSYGNGGGKTLSNYQGKVNIIVTTQRSHPYHVTTPSGGHLGWVTPQSLKVVS